MHSIQAPSNGQPHRILVVGGSYAGLMAAINLLRLAAGNPHLPSSVALPPIPQKQLQNGLKITIVDERDGFCKFKKCSYYMYIVSSCQKTFFIVI